MSSSLFSLIFNLLIFIAVVVYPAASIGGELFVSQGQQQEHTLTTSQWSLLATTSAWAGAIAAGAVLMGWLPGRLLGRAVRMRGYLPLAALIVLPLCLPAYVTYYCWWQAWPATSSLHQWAIANDVADWLHGATLGLGLLGWAWPIAALCVAGPASTTPRERQELLQIDGVGMIGRIVMALRDDFRGLIIGGLITFLFIFNNTTCFDIAGIATFGYELRALNADGADAGTILLSARSAIFIAAAGAILAWWFLRAEKEESPRRPPRPHLAATVATMALFSLTVLTPFALLAVRLNFAAGLDEFVSFYSSEIINTIGVALAAGALAALVAVCLAVQWQDHRKNVRLAANIQAVGWFFAGIAPGIVVATAYEAAYNIGVFNWLYDSPLIVIGGHLARFGFVGAVLGLWLVKREPREIRWMRRLDAADGVGRYIRATWPRLLAAGTATAAIATTLAMSELIVSSRLTPPGFGSIASSVLNAVHYQDPQTVLLASFAMLAIAGVAATIVLLSWTSTRRIGALGLLVCAVVIAGCAPTDPEDIAPLESEIAFGIAGSSPGQFHYPRGIAIDRDRNFIYVVDKLARVQRFDYEGDPQVQWKMPQKELGKPTGLNVSPDGRIFVADTHYHRVAIYDENGNELDAFGEQGTGPGQFVYTTDVEFGESGRVYVSEYGGNDRVQIFNSQGEYLSEFGSLGPARDQFNRPQSMAFSRDHSELYIADACNHRIVVSDPEGNVKRLLGGAGEGAGQLCYPYDLTVLEDGSLLVVEFGNNRIQRISAETGECLGLWGGVGFDEGRLTMPWGIDSDGEEIFVLDSGNNRVQRIHSP